MALSTYSCIVLHKDLHDNNMKFPFNDNSQSSFIFHDIFSRFSNSSLARWLLQGTVRHPRRLLFNDSLIFESCILLFLLQC